MIKLFFLLLLPIFLNASQILSYNIYDRTDRVDIMITFDTPFNGRIKQSRSNSEVVIKLENTSIESSKSKIVNSPFLTSVNIVPSVQYTKIIALVPSTVSLKASKTSDAYGLRLRFSKTIVSQNISTPTTSVRNNANSLSSLPTKQDSGMSTNYYIVISILLIGIVILFILKNKITVPNTRNKSNSWLFKVAKDSKGESEEEVSIRFQKNIDENNSVVMLDFVGQSYLVLMGSNNMLLDKFTDNKPVTQDDFETILQNKHQELNNFLNEDKESKEKDPMQIYKEKAATISYTA